MERLVSERYAEVVRTILTLAATPALSPQPKAVRAARQIDERTGDLQQHEVLNAVRDLVETAEESELSEALVQRSRDAYSSLCDLLGVQPSPDYPHEPDAGDEPADVAMARYLATLCEFHSDDEDEHQAPDPITMVEDVDRAPCFHVITAGYRRFRVFVSEERGV